MLYLISTCLAESLDQDDWNVLQYFLHRTTYSYNRLFYIFHIPGYKCKKKPDQFTRFYVCWIQTSELTNKQTDEANLHWDIDFLVLIVCLKICVNYFQISSKTVERDLEKFFSDLKHLICIWKYWLVVW